MRHLLGIAVTVGNLFLLGNGEPASAQKVMADGIKDLATQIATNVAKEQKRKIAVLPFRELDGQPTVLGTYISEELVTDLFTLGGLDIVERGMLDKLIGEIKLGQTGLIDPDTARKVGKIAGVDAIVTGTITDLQSYVALNCRLIDAQTGRIFSAAQTKIVKDDDLKKILGAPPAAPTAEKEAATKKAARPATIPRFETESYRLVVGTLQKTDKTIGVTLTLQATGDQSVNFQARGWYLLDEYGNRWEGIGSVGDHVEGPRYDGTYDEETIHLVAGTKVTRHFNFTTHGSGEGAAFTMIGTEIGPKSREIVVHGLVAVSNGE